MSEATTLQGLRESGWVERSVRDEMRNNLLEAIRFGRERFPGIHGFDRTVLPALENAVLARHDIILLGLRGQAKTRLLRALVNLLDETVPVVEGCPVNDSPLRPFCKRCRRLAQEKGDQLPVGWLAREDRYREKLATPDVTVADLIGDIDPIKAANLRLDYSDEEVIHYGIIPRTNRGIFAINEIPDLAPRIQVSLLNILEERDLQIRGFPLRIPLDLMMVFSANPEDYTSRGNIITPLKDRIDSQIITHYPRELEIAKKITSQEAWLDRESGVALPDETRDLIEEIAFVARGSDLVDQTSGVSARLPISAAELLVSNLERRRAQTGDEVTTARVADFIMLIPAITGKIELVYEGEQQGPELVARNIIGTAVRALLEKRLGGKLPSPSSRSSEGRLDADRFEPILAWFADGNSIEISDETSNAKHEAELSKVPGLEAIAQEITRDSLGLSFAKELVLEGLHQALMLAREDRDSTITFSEAVRFNVLRTVK